MFVPIAKCKKDMFTVRWRVSCLWPFNGMLIAQLLYLFFVGDGPEVSVGVSLGLFLVLMGIFCVGDELRSWVRLF